MSSEQKNDLLVKKIKIFLIEKDWTKEDIAKCLGIHPNTIRNKLREPDTFSRWELVELFRIMKLSPEEKALLM